ncbi:TldD/PmbA family protein [Candidatus Woesebacteria bacterium]|nr:TldD/PmbA family protein [Candidatus Woesebacteria bacterium]
MNKSKLKSIAEQIFSSSHAQQTEIILSVSNNSLTRFANNQIHQNVAWKNLGVSIRVVVEKNKIGVASTNSFDEASLKQTVARAIELAKLQQPDPYFQSLPSPHIIPTVDQSTYSATEEELAAGVNEIISAAQAKNLTASGAYSNDTYQLAIANSLGVWAYHKGSSCNLSTIVLGKDSSGFASDVAKNTSEINPAEVGNIAVQKTLESAHPQNIDPGEYDVIFEPQAASEMMAFFQWYGPNARIYHEQASPLSGKMGKQVFGKNITLIDDPFHPDIFPMPFDYEGQPKKKMTIVEKGILKNIAYDSYYAKRYDAQNTGHALPAPNTLGPIPLHMYIAPGDKTRNEMIASVKRGLLVTRLWYVRVLNAKMLNITGMTRDGTFLIENGKIVKPVKNLRFNQSIPEALNNVVAIESKLTRLASFEGELVGLMPTLHIRGWHFTSGTLF